MLYKFFCFYLIFCGGGVGMLKKSFFYINKWNNLNASNRAHNKHYSHVVNKTLYLHPLMSSKLNSNFQLRETYIFF